MIDWFHGSPHHIVYRRVVRAEVMLNGLHRLHLGYLKEENGDEEVFSGKTPEEASRKLESYLRRAHGYKVHDSNVDTLEDICIEEASRIKWAGPRQ